MVSASILIPYLFRNIFVLQILHSKQRELRLTKTLVIYHCQQIRTLKRTERLMASDAI